MIPNKWEVRTYSAKVMLNSADNYYFAVDIDSWNIVTRIKVLSVDLYWWSMQDQRVALLIITATWNVLDNPIID